MTSSNTLCATLLVAALAGMPARASAAPDTQQTPGQQARADWVARQVARADQRYTAAYGACARHRLRALFAADARLHPAGAPAPGTPGDAGLRSEEQAAGLPARAPRQNAASPAQR